LRPQHCWSWFDGANLGPGSWRIPYVSWAVPPRTLSDRRIDEKAKQPLWKAVPLSVQRELVQALAAMLSNAILPPRQEESND